VILRHARRRLVTICVTTNPSAEWIAGLVTDAFPWDEAPCHLRRDRRSIRSSLHPSHSGNADTRSSDCAVLTVAERPRRALHRLDSARKPRSPDRVRRSAVASRSEELRFLLQSGPDASLIGQECAGSSAPPKARPHRSHLNFGWAASPICQGLSFAKHKFYDSDGVGDLGRGQTVVSVVVNNPEVEHKVRVQDFERWLDSQGRTRMAL
jgi:hypothetical protein